MIMNKQQVYIETVYLNLINLFLFYFYLFIKMKLWDIQYIIVYFNIRFVHNETLIINGDQF